MKTRLGLQATVAMILIIAATTVQAQHRGRDRDNNSGRDRGNSGRGNNGRHEDRHDNRHDNHHNDNSHNGHHDNNHHGYHRKDVHVYHHHAPVVERRVVHHHHHSRPRYVYYKDYDVYYDCDRQVYISFSGRNWTVSVAQPIRLHRVDIYRASRVDVDYYDDDFTQYLEQRRPHGRVYAEW